MSENGRLHYINITYIPSNQPIGEYPIDLENRQVCLIKAY